MHDNNPSETCTRVHFVSPHPLPLFIHCLPRVANIPNAIVGPAPVADRNTVSGVEAHAQTHPNELAEPPTATTKQAHNLNAKYTYYAVIPCVFHTPFATKHHPAHAYIDSVADNACLATDLIAVFLVALLGAVFASFLGKAVLTPRWTFRGLEPHVYLESMLWCEEVPNVLHPESEPVERRPESSSCAEMPFQKPSRHTPPHSSPKCPTSPKSSLSSTPGYLDPEEAVVSPHHQRRVAEARAQRTAPRHYFNTPEPAYPPRNSHFRDELGNAARLHGSRHTESRSGRGSSETWHVEGLGTSSASVLQRHANISATLSDPDEHPNLHGGAGQLDGDLLELGPDNSGHSPSAVPDSQLSSEAGTQLPQQCPVVLPETLPARLISGYSFRPWDGNSEVADLTSDLERLSLNNNLSEGQFATTKLSAEQRSSEPRAPSMMVPDRASSAWIRDCNAARYDSTDISGQNAASSLRAGAWWERHGAEDTGRVPTTVNRTSTIPGHVHNHARHHIRRGAEWRDFRVEAANNHGHIMGHETFQRLTCRQPRLESQMWERRARAAYQPETGTMGLDVRSFEGTYAPTPALQSIALDRTWRNHPGKSGWWVKP